MVNADEASSLRDTAPSQQFLEPSHFGERLVLLLLGRLELLLHRSNLLCGLSRLFCGLLSLFRSLLNRRGE